MIGLLTGPKALLIGGAVIAALTGALWLQTARLEAAQLRAEAAEAQARAARADIQLLREEIESDREIDTVPDDGLGAVIPDRWRLRNPR